MGYLQPKSASEVWKLLRIVLVGAAIADVLIPHYISQTISELLGKIWKNDEKPGKIIGMEWTSHGNSGNIMINTGNRVGIWREDIGNVRIILSPQYERAPWPCSLYLCC